MYQKLRRIYVQKISLLYHIIVLTLFTLILQGCATPTTPTGGPPDREGPRVIDTKPETGTVNFDGQNIEFSFSEFVNRGSLNGALTVEPDLGLTYSIDWKRKKAIVSFDDPLPDSTTVIVTIGTDFTDFGGNKLAQPVQVAVSTGDEIDEGRIGGRIVDAQTGRGTEGERILLYRSPFDLQQKATYVAETDTGGHFQFNYLSEGAYKILYADDRNRNKIWDRGNERAQPFYREIIELDKGGSDSLQTIYTVRQDTIQPELLGVGLFSSKRMRLRFSEEIVITDSSSIQVQDTLGNHFSDAMFLYQPVDEPFIAFALSEKELNEENNYTLKFSGITDLSGNQLLEGSPVFEGSSQQDTTLQRIIRYEGANGLFQDESVKAVYAKEITQAPIRDSLSVVEAEIPVDQWPALQIQQNKLVVSPREEEWKSGVNYQFLFWNPVTQRRVLIEPDIWYKTNLGEIEITVADTSTVKEFYFDIESKTGNITRTGSFNGSTIISALPPLRYRLVVFEDQNGNNKWDAGSADPYRRPEPYFVRENIPVRSGFTAQSKINFKN